MTRQDGQVVDLYARISDDQAGLAIGTGNQLDALRPWVEARGWTVGEVYRDDSRSATDGKPRPGFEALLRRPVKRPVAVYALDRLARLSGDMERVLTADFPVYSMTAGDLDMSTPDGRMVVRILTAHATAETEKKAARQRLRNAADAKAGKPYWRRRPFGWNLDGTVREEEAAAIRWAADEVLVGNTLAAIVREFNARGLTTPVSKAGGVGGSEWRTVNLRQLLTNERLAGLRTYEGTTVTGSWEPALDEDTWRAVLGILRDPSRLKNTSRTGRTPNTLLTGIAKCPRCGATVQGMGPSYRCPTTHFYRKRGPVDAYVRNRTLSVLLTPGAEALLASDEGPKTGALRTKAGQLRGYLADLEAAASQLGVAEYLRLSAGAKAELATVQQQMSNVDRAELFAGITGAVEHWDEAAERWASLPLARRRAVIGALWDSVEFSLERDGEMVLEPSEHARRVMAAAGGLQVVIPGAVSVWEQ